MSNYIRQIQADLKEAGYYAGEIDGIAGRKTLGAVRFALARGKATEEQVNAVLEQNRSTPVTHGQVTAAAVSMSEPFKLSATSLIKLNGVDARLVQVVKLALKKSTQDFAVIEGLRSKEYQAELVRKGASRTMNSKHLIGHAVDLAPVVEGKISWDWKYYYAIAEAMRAAAKELKIQIRWGGTWSVLNHTIASPQLMVQSYVERRKELGKSAFIDGPHFELYNA